MTQYKVSVIVPCYNEEKTIALLLEALYKQTFPTKEMEVIIADGISTDNTRLVIENYLKEYPGLHVEVADNPNRTIPAALNIAIGEASGEYIVRLDAHSVPDPNYVTLCIEGLDQGLGTNVGGIWKIKPGNDSIIAKSIAIAAAHPLGVGDAKYRYSDQAEHVDTVPFGAFKRDLVKEIGWFDETLLSNEDYEFNVRIRESGGTIWLNPEIRAVYFARSTYNELIKQYWRYGYWKANMLKRYPMTIRLRQAAPPVFVFSILVLPILSQWNLVFSQVLGLEVVSYTLVLSLVGLQKMLMNKEIRYLLTIPIAITLMHISWGSAFLWGIVSRRDN